MNLRPESVITFGRNKGYTLKVIYQYFPEHIEWLINNGYIRIDVVQFEALPNPTPLYLPDRGYTSKFILQYFNLKEEQRLRRRSQIIAEKMVDRLTVTNDEIDHIIKTEIDQYWGITEVPSYANCVNFAIGIGI